MPMILLYGSDRGSNERGQGMTFDWAFGMYVFLVAVIVAAGSSVALIFRRMALRSRKHDEQFHP